MATEKVRIGLIQMPCFRDKNKSIQKACQLLKEAASQGVQIACLPELFATDYFCKVEDHSLFDLAEPIPGPTSNAIAEVAKQTRMTIVTSLFEKRAAGLYHNTCVIIDGQGDITGLYRKMHIPDDPLFYEKFYFTPGDTGFLSHHTEHTDIGMLVCWDQWYPEAARLTAMQGANILFYPTAIGWHPAEKAQYGDAMASMWETIQRSHAVANGCFVAAGNRIGHEPMIEGQGDGIEFWGSSFIADPYGRIIAKAGIDSEEVITADIDLHLIEDTRRNWPFLRDRRIDAYEGITKRFSK